MSGSGAGPAVHLLAEILDTAVVFALPLVERFRGVVIREGVLLRGPAGWSEFAPFRDYTDTECLPWLRAALATAAAGWPEPVRAVVPVNTTVPVVAPERAAELVRHSGCDTAKVKVADPGTSLAADAERVAAVRDALGSAGRVRVDANGAWSADEAVAAIRLLDHAAGGLEYVEQPCASVTELAAVRRRVDVPIAADESIRRSADPLAVARAGAADIAVLKVAPLGGVGPVLELARDCGLAVVISSAVDTSVGLAAGLAAAGALPELPYACGLGTATLLSADVSSTSLRPVSGALTVLRTAPEPDVLQPVPAGSELDTYWRDRLARVLRLLPPG